jgi:hypothetical protein
MPYDTLDLTLLATQQRQILTEVGSIRDDIAVLSTIVLRLDGTLTGLVPELRARHAQHNRMASGIRDLETSKNSNHD